MGVVYRARDVALERPVALKLLSPRLAEDASFRERFLVESRLAASLDHPNVVPVYDAGEVEGQLYLAMRYVPGSDLKERLRLERPLERAEAIAIASQIANALDAAHARGLVHRDIKPSNVLLDDQGHAYLADFGLTRRLAEQATGFDAGLSLGTPAYVAPEQIEGKELDGRADQYSLACLLHECLTGEPPFPRGSEAATLFAHLEEQPPAPQGLEQVLSKALAKDPAERYESCRAFVDDARRALGLEPRRTLWPLAIAGVGVALVGAALLAFFLTRGGGGLPVDPQADSLVRIDPATNTVASRMPVGRLANGVSAAGRYVWVTNAGDGTVWRIDPRSGDALRISAKGTPTAIAADASQVVVGEGFDQQIVTFDADTGARRDVATLGPAIFNGPELAAGPDGIWFGAPDLRYVDKVDDLFPNGTSSLQVTIPQDTRTVDSSYYNFDGIAVGEDAVWVAGDPFDRRVWKVDPRSGRVVAKIPLPFIPDAIAAGAGAVWVSSLLDDTVSRIDPASNRIVATIPVGRGPDAMAVGGGALWVTSSIDDTISRIDPKTNRVVATLPAGGTPTAIAAGPGGVWATVTKPPPPPPKNAIKIGVYADCTGYGFGFEYEDSLAGAELALVRRGGRLVGPDLTEGVRGLSIGGRPVRLYFVCDARGNSSSAPNLIAERRLVDKVGVDVLIGPTVGQDEATLQELARRRPAVTFIDGAGQFPIPDPAPNFFSFIADSAQQMAGIGDYAYRTLHWRNAITIDDTGNGRYAWGQSAAFISEFCSLGGTITKRISIPRGTADLSGVVSELPRSGVDGAFLSVLGPDGSWARLLALAWAGKRGNISKKVLLGTAALETDLYHLKGRAEGLVTGGPHLYSFGAVGSSRLPAWRRHLKDMRKTFPRVPKSEIGGFDVDYFNAMEATLRALEQVHGDLAGGQRRFRRALAKLELDLPSGRTSLDSRHRAVAPNYVWQLQGRKLKPRVIRTIPKAEATFGGYFKPSDPPPSETTPKCVKRTPPPWARR